MLLHVATVDADVVPGDPGGDGALRRARARRAGGHGQDGEDLRERYLAALDGLRHAASVQVSTRPIRSPALQRRASPTAKILTPLASKRITPSSPPRVMVLFRMVPAP